MIYFSHAGRDETDGTDGTQQVKEDQKEKDIQKKEENKRQIDKKLVQSITSRDEDFAQWYTDVVREAKLCDYSGVKGCLNYLPNGYAIWENIQSDLDKRFKDTGVENVYLPVLIPESLLQKEKTTSKGSRLK